MSLIQDYSQHFIGRGRNSVDHARHYLSGLLGTQRRKNIEAISQDVQGADEQGMGQFISASPWSHEALLDQLNGDLDGLLGGHPDSALYIDETAFTKKGKGSVGVQTQYNGSLKKTDNCQVGVFACLGNGSRAGLLDMELYLPQVWVDDPRRLDQAGVPASRRVLRTKPRLALELVLRARERGVRFGWVGFDAYYGCSQTLTAALEDAGEHFVGDVKYDAKVWTAPPTQPGARRLTVRELCGESFASESRELTLRHGTKGPLALRGWARHVWLQSKDHPKLRQCWLIVSQDQDGEWKYSLSNCLEISSCQRLVYMQHQRYFIELAFREAKSQLGMDQYQVRVWKGWYHHMSLVCLAMLFTLKEQMLNQQNLPLLSIRDLTELLDYYLPRQRRSEKQVQANIEQRHRKRRSDILRRHQRNRASPNLTE